MKNMNKRAARLLLAATLASGSVLGWQWFGHQSATQMPAPAQPLSGQENPVVNVVPRAIESPKPIQDIEWFALVPADWEPIKTFNDNIARLEDNDPQAMEALEKLRAAWANAPVEPSMDGAHVRIGGFMIPLDGEGEEVREFLLVPYFGACIHAPPPPANQVIHVFSAQPVEGIGMMDPVFVTGTLKVAHDRTPENTAGLLDAVGYAMQAQAVVRYEVK